MGRQRAAQAGSNWWDEVEEAPRAGLPDATKLANRAKRMRWAVWATIFLAPLSIIGSLATLTAESAPPPAATSDYAKFSEGRSLAISTVEQWLAEDPSPVPGGRVLAWDGAEAKKVKEDLGDREFRTLKYETHTVSVLAGDTTYSVGVLIALDKLQGAKVMGIPSLIAMAPAGDDFADTSPWPNLEETQTPASVESSVKAWMQAYSSGDPESLRLITGDPDADHVYMPLTGATLDDLDIRYTGAVWGKGQDPLGDTPPEQMVLNVEFSIDWIAYPNQSATSAKVSYDLLVIDTNTGAPKVVAWGATGTGQSLTKYQNHLTGREIKAADNKAIKPITPTDEAEAE